MSGNAKQRRKARRARARTSVSGVISGVTQTIVFPPAAPHVHTAPTKREHMVTGHADEMLAMAKPSKWWLVAGVAAVVVLVAMFVTWLWTIPTEAVR